MNKRLFLLMFVLFSLCPDIYGADLGHELFGPPLQGEIIAENAGVLDREYATFLSKVALHVVAPLFVAACVRSADCVASHVPFMRAKKKAIVQIVGGVSTCSALLLTYIFIKLSKNAIDQYSENLNLAIPRHNDAINPDNHIDVSSNVDEKRFLRMRRSDGGHFPGTEEDERRYDFDALRKHRKAMKSGCWNKALLGPWNLWRVHTVNTKLHVLDDQLENRLNVHDRKNIKPACR